ncbi:hypothetical protein DQ04_05151040 [Trypanosoma grayi]|uniref:hypothetical protein n=1 Tax=Trypanosoma grayi TaxID=71804 RepID=UPI0004F3F516|nr:hypothetical protein DQ04_05151040 [Trypanosoma grayi]KEG09479.1 hypothetical protein DQ04_05151040 [Trypanosoma grayi]
MAAHVKVCEMGASYGVGTFATRPLRAGDVLLEELPVAFTLSLSSRLDSRFCMGCGTRLATLQEECERLARLAQGVVQQQQQQPSDGDNNNNDDNLEAVKNGGGVQYAETLRSPRALYESLKEFGASSFFSRGVAMDDDDDGDDEVQPLGAESEARVRFCCAKCRAHCLHERGGKFLLSMPPIARKTVAAQTVHSLREPSAETIMRCAVALDTKAMEEAWPSKAHTLATLEYLANIYNERLRLILALLSRCLSETTSGADLLPLKDLQDRFRETVQAMVVRYAEGAPRTLTEQQRAFLRFSWKCVCRWLGLCCAGANSETTATDPFAWLSLQLYLRCYWLADANVHMFVVVSPLYSLLCQKLPVLCAICRRSEGEGEGAQSALRLRRQMCVLRELFRLVDPCAAHATGVALYDAATKINHSCVPCARFVPTHGRVRAVVVALRDIASGEEIRSSYVDLSAYASKVERQDYLLTHYGFSCDCPLCCVDE